MSGKFSHIELNDYSTEADLFGPYLEGRTHGCDCCSVEKRITVENLNEHIESLKEAIVKAEKLRRYFHKRGFSKIKGLKKWGL
jgi:hypothetical protein